MSHHTPRCIPFGTFSLTASLLLVGALYFSIQVLQSSIGWNPSWFEAYVAIVLLVSGIVMSASKADILTPYLGFMTAVGSFSATVLPWLLQDNRESAEAAVRGIEFTIVLVMGVGCTASVFPWLFKTATGTFVGTFAVMAASISILEMSAYPATFAGACLVSFYYSYVLYRAKKGPVTFETAVHVGPMIYLPTLMWIGEIISVREEIMADRA